MLTLIVLPLICFFVFLNVFYSSCCCCVFKYSTINRWESGNMHLAEEPSLCISDSFQQNSDQTSAAEERQTCRERLHHCMYSQNAPLLYVFMYVFSHCTVTKTQCQEAYCLCVDHSGGDQGQQGHSVGAGGQKPWQEGMFALLFLLMHCITADAEGKIATIRFIYHQ